MSLTFLPTNLPLEVRSRIWGLLDNKFLAKYLPEVFWSIAPNYLRFLSIGRSMRSQNDLLQTELVGIYPNCGHLVERLTILTDIAYQDITTNFLNDFPTHRKLLHLSINLSPTNDTIFSAGQLPYLELLVDLIAESPDMLRLSFGDVHPHYTLINSAAHRLTRLDIGHIYPSEEEIFVPLPPHLQILSIPPAVVSYLTHPPPQTLHTLIIKPDNLTSFFLLQELQHFITQGTSLTKLAIIDKCTLSSFYLFYFANLCLFRPG
jgi:hypothetical protein